MQDDLKMKELTEDQQTKELEYLLLAFGPSRKTREREDEEGNESYVLGYN